MCAKCWVSDTTSTCYDYPWCEKYRTRTKEPSDILSRSTHENLVPNVACRSTCTVTTFIIPPSSLTHARITVKHKPTHIHYQQTNTHSEIQQMPLCVTLHTPQVPTVIRTVGNLRLHRMQSQPQLKLRSNNQLSCSSTTRQTAYKISQLRLIGRLMARR